MSDPHGLMIRDLDITLICKDVSDVIQSCKDHFGEIYDRLVWCPLHNGASVLWEPVMDDIVALTVPLEL